MPSRRPDPDPDPTADADAEAAAVYAAEEATTAGRPLRRFRRFADITAYVGSVTTSEWWDETFPSAPVEVALRRRSRAASASLAATTDDQVGIVAIVDGHGWGLDTVLHELAHLAAGPAAAHGAGFRHALVQLWRHEAGAEAAALLERAFSDASPAGGRPDGSPRPAPPS